MSLTAAPFLFYWDAVRSPDSTKILFASERNEISEISVIDADGSNLVRLIIVPTITPRFGQHNPYDGSAERMMCYCDLSQITWN